MSYYNVEGHSDLARDPKTNSIINVNSLDYEKYITRKKSKEKKDEKLNEIENEVFSIKKDLNEIKFLLQEFLSESKKINPK